MNIWKVISGYIMEVNSPECYTAVKNSAANMVFQFC